MNIRLTIALSIFLLLISAPSLMAQSYLMRSQPEDTPLVGLRFMRPNFAGSDNADLSLLSGTYDLYFHAPLSSSFHFVADIPFCGFSSSDWNTRNWNGDIALGNIYLGARHQPDVPSRTGSELELGIWLPTANSEMGTTQYLGAISNYHEMQRHTPESVTIFSNYAYHRLGAGDETGMFSFQAGPELFLPNSQEYETELYVHYSISGGLYTTSVSFGVEILGQFWVTEDVDQFSDHFTHSLVIGGQLTNASVRPGIFYMLPLEDSIETILDHVLAIKIEFVLP